MSDVSAVEVIAGVLREHEYNGAETDRHERRAEFCTCGWRSTFAHRTHTEHQAAEVDKALGGLTREVSQATRMCSHPGSDGPCVGKHHGRWVGGWTPEEAS